MAGMSVSGIRQFLDCPKGVAFSQSTIMSNRLAGKVAVITGAASGIGKGIAIQFAREGAQVIVNDLNRARGDAAVAEIKKRGGQARFIRADVRSKSQVNRMIASVVRVCGKIDILVNNAISNTVSITSNDFEAVVSVGLRGTWNCCQAVLPEMKKISGGSIINIASVNALLGLSPIHVYCGVKGGIVSMGRSLATALGKFGIRVNMIAPGTIQTEIWAPILKQHPNVHRQLVKFYPVGRLGTPQDVAYAAVWLASDESTFVNGAVIPVDGGLTAGIHTWPDFT